MAVAFQGFETKKNLVEAALDRSILNNLAGTPTADDIALFSNNNRNTSTITVSASNIISGNTTVYIPNSIAVFTDKTKLTINNNTYYVKNSNNIDTFQLSTKFDLSDTVTPPVGDYVRNDIITLNDLSNIAVIRRSNDVDSTDSDRKLGFLDYGTNVFLGNNTVKELLELIESNLDFYKYKSSKSVSKTSNFLGTKPMSSYGYVFIQDPDNVNNAGLTNNSPGLFIYNTTSNTGIRAFSSNENPWSDISYPLALSGITGGSGYTNGTYTNVTLTPVSGTNTDNPIATITVSSGAVTAVSITNYGSGFSAFREFTTAAANIGGTGTGFKVPVGAYLQCSSTQVTVGKLNLNVGDNGIVLQAKSGSTIKSTVTLQDVTTSTFTHKTPITINGQTYFLCLKKEN